MTLDGGGDSLVTAVVRSGFVYGGSKGFLAGYFESYTRIDGASASDPEHGPERGLELEDQLVEQDTVLVVCLVCVRITWRWLSVRESAE